MIDVDKEYRKMRRAHGKGARHNPSFFKGGDIYVGQLADGNPVRRICIGCQKIEVPWESKSRLCAPCS